MTEPFALYAVRYATNPRRRAVSNFLSNMDVDDAPMPMDYFVWLAVNADHAVLVDTGMDEDLCRARGHTYLCDPLDAVAQFGIQPGRIRHVVLTHLHWDHAGNLGRLPEALFHAHPMELAHACGEAMLLPALRRPYHEGHVRQAIALLYAQRLRFTGEASEVVPGIRTHHVGGHSPGLQVVQVLTRRGLVVLAADAMHYYANRERHNPFPILVDTQAAVRAWLRLDTLADSAEHIVAGHDPLVMTRYPPAGTRPPGLAVRLDQPPMPQA